MARGRPDRRRSGRDAEPLRGWHPVREALRAGRRPLSELRIAAPADRPELAELLDLARNAGVRVRQVPADTLGREGPGERSAQGLELFAGPLPEFGLAELARAGAAPRTLVALDGVEDPQNLGAIVRVAEAAGVAGLILTRRRSPPLSAAVARASAGAIEWLPVARVPNLPRALNDLKKGGFWAFGSDPEAGDGLYDLPDRLLAGDRVIVLGAEGRGLRRGVGQVLDHRVRIPMAGRVDSLNVSAAAAVVLFEFRRRSRLATSA
ncbi:MAG: TrmH family RNA methyltransferase [Myxococcota bacterium]